MNFICLINSNLFVNHVINAERLIFQCSHVGTDQYSSIISIPSYQYECLSVRSIQKIKILLSFIFATMPGKTPFNVTGHERALFIVLTL